MEDEQDSSIGIADPPADSGGSFGVGQEQSGQGDSQTTDPIGGKDNNQKPEKTSQSSTSGLKTLFFGGEANEVGPNFTAIYSIIGDGKRADRSDSIKVHKKSEIEIEGGGLDNFDAIILRVDGTGTGYAPVHLRRSNRRITFKVPDFDKIFKSGARIYLEFYSKNYPKDSGRLLQFLTYGIEEKKEDEKGGGGASASGGNKEGAGGAGSSKAGAGGLTGTVVAAAGEAIDAVVGGFASGFKRGKKDKESRDFEPKIISETSKGALGDSSNFGIDFDYFNEQEEPEELEIESKQAKSSVTEEVVPRPIERKREKIVYNEKGQKISKSAEKRAGKLESFSGISEGERTVTAGISPEREVGVNIEVEDKIKVSGGGGTAEIKLGANIAGGAEGIAGKSEGKIKGEVSASGAEAEGVLKTETEVQAGQQQTEKSGEVVGSAGGLAGQVSAASSATTGVKTKVSKSDIFKVPTKRKRGKVVLNEEGKAGKDKKEEVASSPKLSVGGSAVGVSKVISGDTIKSAEGLTAAGSVESEQEMSVEEKEQRDVQKPEGKERPGKSDAEIKIDREGKPKVEEPAFRKDEGEHAAQRKKAGVVLEAEEELAPEEAGGKQRFEVPSGMKEKMEEFKAHDKALKQGIPISSAAEGEEPKVQFEKKNDKSEFEGGEGSPEGILPDSTIPSGSKQSKEKKSMDDIRPPKGAVSGSKAGGGEPEAAPDEKELEPPVGKPLSAGDIEKAKEKGKEEPKEGQEGESEEKKNLRQRINDSGFGDLVAKAKSQKAGKAGKEADKTVKKAISPALNQAAKWVWVSIVPTFGLSIIVGAVAGDIIWLVRSSIMTLKVKVQVVLWNLILVILLIFILAISLYAGCTQPIPPLLNTELAYKGTYLGVAGFGDVCVQVFSQVPGLKNVVSKTDLVGSGKCEAVKNGPASMANLANSCFSDRSRQASSIANAESGGIETRASGTDKCAQDGKSVSWGLFQINISAHKVNGLDCPSAFENGPYTAQNKNCRVINQPLYDQCVSAATDAQTNIEKACEISSNGAVWSAWGANRLCGF